MRHHPTIVAAMFLAIIVYVVEETRADQLQPRVEVEEDVYTYQPADNGAGPMWCYGNTCVVRLGSRLFVSGLETVPHAKPLNNCLPLLLERTSGDWQQVFRGEKRTREPCPLAARPDGRVVMSVNPTLNTSDEYSGPSRPQILRFEAAAASRPPQVVTPRWKGEPRFSEHSYRSFAADGASGELILFQNVGYDHAQWTFCDRNGRWSEQGKLDWPWGAEYDKPQPIRLCYATVALHDRAVYFCAVSDVIEPYTKWREYKKELTGKDWDYDFRRLFFTWCDDIRTGEFHDWIEIASRDKTCGWIFPNDLHVGPTSEVHLLWNERAIDERLREEFFPDARQRHSLEYAILHDGAVVGRRTLVEGGEGLGPLRVGRGRFHVTRDDRLLVFHHVGGTNEAGRPISENRLLEIGPDAAPGQSVTVPLEKPLGSFFTNTVRAGCQASDTLDVLGDVGGTLRYVRIGLGSAFAN